MRPSVLLNLHRRRNHPAASGRAPLGRFASEQRPSLEDFVDQAASRAAERGASVLELGLPPTDHSRHFDRDRYRWLGLPLAAGARQPSQSPLPVDDEQFGIVLCPEAVAASPEPQGLLTELNRAMEPTGLLFLTAPLVVPNGSEGYAQWRNRLGLNYLIEASGFVIEDLQALERSPSYGVVASKRQRPGHAARTPSPLTPSTGDVPVALGWSSATARRG